MLLKCCFPLGLHRLTSPVWLEQFQTADPGLAEANQATLSLESVAYHSPNQRYLYINTPMFGRSLVVGEDTQVHVQTASPSYLNIQALNYLVRKAQR